jgi:hypothetical protein
MQLIQSERQCCFFSAHSEPYRTLQETAVRAVAFRERNATVKVLHTNNLVISCSCSICQQHILPCHPELPPQLTGAAAAAHWHTKLVHVQSTSYPDNQIDNTTCVGASTSTREVARPTTCSPCTGRTCCADGPQQNITQQGPQLQPLGCCCCCKPTNWTKQNHCPRPPAC